MKKTQVSDQKTEILAEDIIKTYQIIENLDNSYGGPAKSVPYLAKYLADLGIQQSLLSLRLYKDEKNEVIETYNLHWKKLETKGLKKLRYSKRLKEELSKIAQRERDVIFHVHNIWNYVPYISYKIAKKRNIPLIISPRGTLYKWSLDYKKIRKNISWAIFQKECLQNASCIHATDFSEVKAIKDLGISNHVALIPNGINLSEFSNELPKNDHKRKLSLDINKKYLLFMSRIHPKKGLDILIDAFGEISSKYQNLELLVAGPEEDKAYLEMIKSKLKMNNIQKRVHFLGFLTGEKRINYLLASEFFVLPTHSENFGIAIAEALAAGLPVITTTGTPWKQIRNLSAGYYIDLSKENLIDALMRSQTVGINEYKNMSINAKNIAKEYDWMIQAKKMYSLYQWVGGNGKKPAFVFD